MHTHTIYAILSTDPKTKTEARSLVGEYAYSARSIISKAAVLQVQRLLWCKLNMDTNLVKLFVVAIIVYERTITECCSWRVPEHLDGEAACLATSGMTWTTYEQ